MAILNALIENPRLVVQHRNIFLLSHMRANTSLFGHLIGSHPEVEGYYEMHIGYYSWKSLWRQKLLHFAGHRAKPSARYMFDKVLHDGHHVAPEILLRDTSRTIFMLREPEQSVRSLVALYRKRNPQLPEADPQGATDYYARRVQQLADIAETIGPRYFYLDAERLIGDSVPTLAALSKWLGLSTPIPSEYDTYANTGRGNSGDHSARLKSGKIHHGRSDYSEIVLTPAQLDAAREAYVTARTRLVEGSARYETRAEEAPVAAPVGG